jgi:hypothetical protein
MSPRVYCFSCRDGGGRRVWFAVGGGTWEWGATQHHAVANLLARVGGVTIL